MEWINTIAVSISMAFDCMTVGATDGMQEPNMKKRKVLLISFLFGLFQGAMPVIGYFLGYGFKSYLEPYIPWIAFALLLLLGVKNIAEWCKERKGGEEEKEKKELTISTLLIQSVATSIDALTIGFVYLNETIGKAMLIFLIIGLVTFVLSFLAILLGKKVGTWLEKWSGLIAGNVFILVGLKILLEGIL